MAKAKKSTPAKPAPKPAKAPVKPAPKAAAVKPADTKSPSAKPASAKAVAAKPAAAKPAAKVAPKAPAKPVAKEPVKAAAKPTAKSAPAVTAKPSGKGVPAKKVKADEPVKPFVGKHPFLSKADLEDCRKALLNLRDRLVDEIGFLSGDNLARNSREASGDLSNYSLHMADQGTDNFDREFALNLVSGEHDQLYEIDEALQRIDAGTYGICEMTQQPIEKERLKYIPHARYCMKAQSELERGKTKYRPFGPTLSQL